MRNSDCALLPVHGNLAVSDILTMAINKHIFYPDSLAKNATAFLVFPFPIVIAGFLHADDSIPQRAQADVRYQEKH
jgi:hypothetical protein